MVFTECEEMPCDRESARNFGNAFDVGDVCCGGELEVLEDTVAKLRDNVHSKWHR